MINKIPLDKLNSFIFSTIPKDIIDLLTLLDSTCSAFLVGGFVRDRIVEFLNKERKIVENQKYKNTLDIDIAIDCKIEKYIHLLSNFTYQINEKYNILTLFINDDNTQNFSDANAQNISKSTQDLNINNAQKNVDSRHEVSKIEIASFRVENDFIDGRNAQKIEFVKDIFVDSKRRDFRFNALYFGLKTGLIDTQNGLLDLINQELNFIGNANERIKEDHSRIFRAIRFASVMDFSFSQDTKNAIIKNQFLLLNVSAQNIYNNIKAIIKNIHFSFIKDNINTLKFDIFKDIFISKSACLKMIFCIKYMNLKISKYLNINQSDVLLIFVNEKFLSKKEIALRNNLIFLNDLLKRFLKIDAQDFKFAWQSRITISLKFIFFALSLKNKHAVKNEILDLMKLAIYVFLKCKIPQKMYLINIVDNITFTSVKDINIHFSVFRESKKYINNEIYMKIFIAIQRRLIQNDAQSIVKFLQHINYLT